MNNKVGDSKHTISLPKGGGSIKGIGETFQPHLFSGTGNFSAPIATSPGRAGFGPQLTLQYSTGNGNGPFGLGWQLSVSHITRKTEKGLPTYKDEDVFVLSGAEDLVPQLEYVEGDTDHWQPVVRSQGDYVISLYRPRTEGLFARIEMWMGGKERIHWRTISRDNVTNIYGRSATARIADPNNATHIFEWLLEETFDDKGNHIAYEYVQEDPHLALPDRFEHNHSYTQAYLRRILYGNTPDNLDAARQVGPTRTTIDHIDPLRERERHYLFEVLFDYGDTANAWPPPIPYPFPSDVEETIPVDWPVREDRFSTFRAGFEIRTLRRCRRVLMLHHFNESGLEDAPLVKSTEFGYTSSTGSALSLLQTITVSGYRKSPDDPQNYMMRSMPPLAFKYSAFEPKNQRYQSVAANGGDLPPRSLAAPDFTLVDLFGNALPDILQTANTGYYY